VKSRNTIPVRAKPLSLLKDPSTDNFTQPGGGLSQGISGGFLTEHDALGPAPANSIGPFPFNTWSVGVSLIEPKIFI
jgi:hypothetical protein